MTRIWLCRHAETATPHVFHGAESDEPLSVHGHAQAEAAAGWFASYEPQVIITSAMTRTIQTAKPLLERCRVPHIIEHDLHERKVGSLCGTSFSLSEGPWIETLKHWTAGDVDFTTPGAESYTELQSRLLPVWRRIVNEHTGRRIVIVAHGVVCKVILLSILPAWGPRKWHEFGKVENLATSELSPDSAGSWAAHTKITVPPPVLELNRFAAAPQSAKSTA